MPGIGRRRNVASEYCHFRFTNENSFFGGNGILKMGFYFFGISMSPDLSVVLFDPFLSPGIMQI